MGKIFPQNLKTKFWSIFSEEKSPFQKFLIFGVEICDRVADPLAIPFPATPRLKPFSHHTFVISKVVRVMSTVFKNWRF